MQFEKDIFISYAHIDDEALIEGQKGWISEFHRALEIRLAQLLGRRPIIWRDQELQGNDLFDKQIVDQFPNVAIVISILSPRYVKSEWCVREVNEFYNISQNNIGFSINNKARIFKVIKTPVRIDLHPEKIQNILGYEFYSTDPDTNRVKEFSNILGQQTERQYWEKLDDLAHDICAFLEDVERFGTKSGMVGGALNGKKGSKKIFLSESSYDTKEFRDNIKRELQDYGHLIFPDKQLPLIAPQLQEDVKSYLAQADLSIHILGSGYGIVPEGTKKSIIELQNETANVLSAGSNLPRLIWIPEGIQPNDDRQISFLNQLNNDNNATIGADLVKGSIEEFKDVIVDKLKSIQQPEPEEEAKEDAIEKSATLVYLICDILDINDITPIEDFLFNNGCEVVIPVFEGDETQIREDHIENLKACDAVIIFFGQANELWLRSKMRDFMKISGYGRKKPLGFKAVYLSGPPSISKQRFRTLEAEVVNGLEQIPEAQLKSIIAKLK